MRHILFIIIAAVSAATCYAAETIPVRRCEVEFHAGMTYSLGSYHGGKARPGAGIGLDVRYNFDNSPWDMGVFAQIDCAEWKFRPQGPDDPHSKNNRSISCGLSGAYNFRQGHKVNPFAGIGVGIDHIQEVGTWRVPARSNTICSFIPKVGVELLYFVRLNAYCQISRKGYHTFGLSLGLTVGGWPKKKKDITVD